MRGLDIENTTVTFLAHLVPLQKMGDIWPFDLLVAWFDCAKDTERSREQVRRRTNFSTASPGGPRWVATVRGR